MPIEIAVGFYLLRGLELAPVFGLAVGEAVAVGAQFGLPSLGTLAGDPKIDQFSHCRVSTVSGYAYCRDVQRAVASPRNASAKSQLCRIRSPASIACRLLFWGNARDVFNTRLVDNNRYLGCSIVEHYRIFIQYIDFGISYYCDMYILSFERITMDETSMTTH